MATTEQKAVTAETLISATVKYNNNDDSARAYDISADVTMQNGAVQNIQSGVVREKGTQDGMMNLATFNTWTENNMSVTFQTVDNTQVLDAINKFIKDVKEAVKTKTISA